MARFAANPLTMRSVNGWASIFWAANFPAVIAVYWLAPDVWKQASILYLALVSVYANFAGHISGWQSANTEAQLRDDIDTPE